MSLQLRFAGPDATDDELREALVQDVLHTRRGPRGTRSAFELFDEAWPWLVGDVDLPDAPGRRVDLTSDPALQQLAAVVAELRAHREAIAGRSLGGGVLARLVVRAHEGTAACRDLVARYPEAPRG